MQRRTILIGGLIIVGAAAWYAFRPERLFIDKTVNESLTVADASGDAAGAMLVASGHFHGVHHDTKGTASIYRTSDGKRVLRFTDFQTSNGPDVRVYLVAAADANDNATVTSAGFVELGPMKGNQGDQNYDVPDSVDLAKYRAVTIWCKRFAVNFATAPLAEGAMPTANMPGDSARYAAGVPGATIIDMARFHSNAHETKGLATIYDLGGGRRVLRLTEFETSNGPDVRIYLVAAPDVQNDATVKQAGFIDLGAMKGNKGDQNYDIPAGIDLTKYRTATVWCRRFSVNFGSAPLSSM